jgi:hypothetical protein
VTYTDPRIHQRGKEKKLSPIKVSQRMIQGPEMRPRMDFLLTSLRVIRISDSFLPPLAQQPSLVHTSASIVVHNPSLPSTPGQKKASLPSNENSARMNLVSSSSAANEEELDRKVKKHSTYQFLDSAASLAGTKIPIIKDGSSRRLNELKRSFKSEDKREGTILSSSNHANQGDPERKIYDWL